jgi:hypothetical protein
LEWQKHLKQKNDFEEFHPFYDCFCIRNNGTRGRSTGDSYSSKAPDHTSGIFIDLLFPILWFVFPAELIRSMTICYVCHFMCISFFRPLS